MIPSCTPLPLESNQRIIFELRPSRLYCHSRQLRAFCNAPFRGGSNSFVAASGETLDLFERGITPDPRWAPVFFRTSAPGVARSANVCRAGDYVYPAQPIIGMAPGTAMIRTTSWTTDPPTESGAVGSVTITVEPRGRDDTK